MQSNLSLIYKEGAEKLSQSDEAIFCSEKINYDYSNSKLPFIKRCFSSIAECQAK